MDKAKRVGEEISRNRNDCKSGGINYGLLFAPNIKTCLLIDHFGFVKEHKTFKEFNVSKRLLDCSQYFKMIQGEKICDVA